MDCVEGAAVGLEAFELCRRPVARVLRRDAAEPRYEGVVQAYLPGLKAAAEVLEAKSKRLAPFHAPDQLAGSKRVDALDERVLVVLGRGCF